MAMTSPKFEISNSTFMTSHLDVQNYSVNESDVYQTWTDGNWEEHRDIVRKQISGTLRLGFQRASDLQGFLLFINTYRQADGWYWVTLYVNNKNAVELIKAFLDVKTEAKWDRTNERQWHVVTVTVRQV